MYVYEAKVFLREWILCLSSIFYHFYPCVAEHTCMPHSEHYRKSEQSLTNRINLSAFGHEAPDATTFLSTRQFYPSFFQLQQTHISSRRKTAGPASSKVTAKTDLEFIYVYPVPATMEPVSIWGTSVHWTWEALFPDKLLCYINTPPREKTPCSSLSHNIWKEMGWETALISYWQNLQVF